ncbi:hypothetical protein AAFC00_005644 [Neodothiora populina]|uniref:Xylanolytic transcriptional activator regulatory domain-containing protein n=1 Tax=Neodothiora populina TaxID=2781224 RepID=A0ABR3PLL6_9PEZI
MQGETNSLVWRRLGDLATDVYAIAMNHDPEDIPGIPFFLAECRRKTFAAVYQLDKHIATVFDRPPRLSRHHSNSRMPLDVSNEELLVDVINREDMQFRLDSEGWNKDGQYSSATWVRLRYILGMFREEILEYPFLPATMRNGADLRDLSKRCHTTWESLPAHLCYTPGFWESGIPPAVCLMLTIVHLSYLQVDFQIYRMLGKSEREPLPQLLEFSAEILATLLQLGRSRDKAVFLHQDFSYLMLGFGLPSAIVLATALQANNMVGGQQVLPSCVSRSTLIRNLSVFIFHLESFGSHGEMNYSICAKASKVISRVLDGVLDSPNLASAHSSDPHSSFDIHEDTSTAVIPPAEPLSPDGGSIGAVDLPILDDEGLDEFNLPDWVSQIDWTGTSGQWSTF